jgi:hypothetical protein
MSRIISFAFDLVAVAALAFGLYFPRHRRRDMLVAFLGVNVGVLAASAALASASVGAGLGLGLFGVLSIIRLRSTELDQSEVAYYFSALALGLLGGISLTPAWLVPVLMAAVLTALYVGDHPRLLVRYRSQVVTLDRAYTSEPELVGRLEELLHARVHRINVRKVDLVADTTTVEVRHEPRPEPPEGAEATAGLRAIGGRR